MLYPLKFKPFFKEKIWGGNKIKSLLHRPVTNMTHCGESWEISAIEDNVSVVANGFFADNNDLNELIEVYMGELLGDKVYDKYGLGFPLLVKFIDATDDLSVQVHPDDKLAKERYGMNGKTEMWYVIQADEGAGLYVGFKEGVTRDQYWDAVDAGTVDQLLRFYPVKKGELYFIPAGTVHAIGKGVLLAEIQQPSDVTYRIFDWNRVDENGNSRELHVKKPSTPSISRKTNPKMQRQRAQRLLTKQKTQKTPQIQTISQQERSNTTNNSTPLPNSCAPPSST